MTIAIHDEIKSQNTTLDHMQTNIQSNQTLLNRTMNNMNNMIESHNTKQTCWIVLAIVGIFFIIYFWLKFSNWRKSKDLQQQL